jgi:hypothetical protein
MSLTEGKNRKFVFLYVYFSNLDKLQNKKIRTAALLNLSVIRKYSGHLKVCCQKNHPSAVEMYLDIHFKHAFKPMEAFKTIW